MSTFVIVRYYNASISPSRFIISFIVMAGDSWTSTEIASIPEPLEYQSDRDNTLQE